MFAAVDWSKTRAYALGLNGVFLNLSGREAHGIVSPADAEGLQAELIQGLSDWRDPQDGARPIRRVSRAQDLYHGAAIASAPDLVIGYDRGYRASWQTSLGGVPATLIDDNLQAWSGDHCVASELVPGHPADLVPVAGTGRGHRGRRRAGACRSDARLEGRAVKPGWLDHPAPLLEVLDGALAHVLPDAARVLVCGLLVSYVGMRLYARSSNQRRLRAVSRLTRQVRRRLMDPDIAFADLIAASRRSIALSLRHLALVLLPSLLAMLPLLLVMPWLSNHFGAQPPRHGTMLTWCVSPVADAGRVRIGDGMPDATGCTRRAWPGPDRPMAITLDGDTVAQAPWRGGSDVLHARRWWNRLIGNPAGELPERAGDVMVHANFPARSLLPFGPAWLGHWLALFIAPGLIAGFYWRWRWKLV
jgi:hypothetical protein